MLPVQGRRKTREQRERGNYESFGVAVVVLLGCALLALSMSQKMVLQHHYGHHMFGDDLAQGARLSMRSHKRPHHHKPALRTGLRGTMQDVVEEVEAGVATVEERIADELHGYLRAPQGMDPEAFVKVTWGDSTQERMPVFVFWCSSAPSIRADQREVGLRGVRRPPDLRDSQGCEFLASFDGEWERRVGQEEAAECKPPRPLDGGEHTLRVRAVDSRGYVQMTPTVFRFFVEVQAEPEHREIRWVAPDDGSNSTDMDVDKHAHAVHAPPRTHGTNATVSDNAVVIMSPAPDATTIQSSRPGLSYTAGAVAGVREIWRVGVQNHTVRAAERVEQGVQVTTSRSEHVETVRGARPVLRAATVSTVQA